VTTGIEDLSPLINQKRPGMADTASGGLQGTGPTEGAQPSFEHHDLRGVTGTCAVAGRRAMED